VGKSGDQGPSEQRSGGGDARATGARERVTLSESVENLADLAEKRLKKGDFTPKLLVFPTRFLGNFVDGKRVMCTLHQNRGTFFHFFHSGIFEACERLHEGASR